MRDFLKTTDPVHFVFPIDGDFLNRYDGTEDADGLHLTVRLKAPFDAELYVNETPCTFDRETGEYSCEVNITHYRDTLVAVDKKNGYRAEIVVFRAYDPTKKTYFTVDDCIIFLYDLAMEPEKYESLFDHPFLNVFKTAHDRYGTVVNLHLYYEYNDECARDFSDHKAYFNLSMMPDKWKKEWEENADWLTVSYHAHANYPDMPWKIYSKEEIDRSIQMVHDQIRRFAGEKSLSSCTELHWGNGSMDVIRAFRENGYKMLEATFRVVDDAEPYQGYYGRDGIPSHLRGETTKDAYDNAGSDRATVRQVTAVKGTGRDFWYDRVEDVICIRTDITLNVIEQNRIVPWLDDFFTVPQRCGFFTPMIHEEYFYSDYFNYIPDCRERILTACKYAFDRGYVGCHPGHVLLER